MEEQDRELCSVFVGFVGNVASGGVVMGRGRKHKAQKMKNRKNQRAKKARAKKLREAVRKSRH
jgi:hypothetical protein